jgi:uncharacterized protein (TIGR02265 family)
MARMKATDIVTLKKVLRSRTDDSEQRLLSKLSPNLCDLYQNSLAFAWNEIDQQTQLYHQAAHLLFPAHPHALHQLGRTIAQQVYTGIYRVLLRIPSTEFLIGQGERVWRTYFDEGKFGIKRLGPQKLEVIISDFPDLPKDLRDYIAGHIQALLELAGAKGISVMAEAQSSQPWCWQVSWQ